MWLTNPLAQYGLTAGGLGACLYLFLSAKRDLRAAVRRLEKERIVTETAIRLISAECRDLAEKFRESEERTGMLVAPAPTRSGLNLNTRTQALRMARRGDRPEQIAAALGIPESEVELLVKVQQVARGSQGGVTADVIPRPDAQDETAAFAGAKT
jgi:hypothetical protein